MFIIMLLKQKILIRNAIVSLTILILFITSCVSSGNHFGIIFSANLDGNQDLYRADSQNFQLLERLTFTPLDSEQDLKITEHGEQILFSVLGTNLGWNTYIMDLEAKSTIELNDSAFGWRSIRPITWSFDKSWAVIRETQTGDIYIASPDKKNVKELEIPHIFDFSIITDVNYSPDGKQLAYTEYHNPTPPLSTKSSFLFDFETKLVIPLVDDETATCDEPRWSPNGKQILLYCDLSTDGISENNHIFLFDVLDNDTVTIKEVAGFPCGRSPGAKFAWSPNGTQFIAAYCEMNDAPRSLFIFNSDGSLERTFPPLEPSPNTFYVTEMVWSPDGKKIIFIAGESEDELDIYMMNPDGSGKELLTSQSANYKDLSVFNIDSLN